VSPEWHGHDERSRGTETGEGARQGWREREFEVWSDDGMRERESLELGVWGVHVYAEEVSQQQKDWNRELEMGEEARREFTDWEIGIRSSDDVTGWRRPEMGGPSEHVLKGALSLDDCSKKPEKIYESRNWLEPPTGEEKEGSDIEEQKGAWSLGNGTGRTLGVVGKVSDKDLRYVDRGSFEGEKEAGWAAREQDNNAQTGLVSDKGSGELKQGSGAVARC
jgi:hypothetical protein